MKIISSYLTKMPIYYVVLHLYFPFNLILLLTAIMFDKKIIHMLSFTMREKYIITCILYIQLTHRMLLNGKNQLIIYRTCK